MSKITQNDFYNGQTILVNKPKSWTSFDVVNKMRSDVRHTYQIPFVKIGHAGTLDPLASGLLIICIGKNTKKIDQFQGLEKEYTGTIMLGATTPSYDFETQIDERYPIAHITPQLINEAAKKFVGAVWQYPPNFSAKKIQGERAYDIARSGGQPDVKPVLVNISKFEIVSVLLPMVEFKVTCGKGVYVRSLAHDLGRQLGCGGVLASLCRTRIGKYKLKDASEIKDWMEAVEPVAPKKRIPVRTAMKKMKERAKERKKIAKAESKPVKKSSPKKKSAAKKKKK
ncbi:MAG: tRNA pseudouridine(55) synthase TruB [Bacteroidetes bacterium]|nr:tRNA pseudouridine(55) synthase TruB [Bacteroidota bacterium]